jgi:hypothetical protein
MEDLLADSVFTVTPTYAAIPENLAALANGATASTSRIYATLNHSRFAIDSDPDTCWFPLYAGQLSPPWDDPTGPAEWLMVTFPANKLLRRVVVKSYTPKHYADDNCVLSAYALQYWDGGGWVILANVVGNTQETLTIDFDEIITTKIRLLVTGGLYLSGLEAYGTPSPPSPPTPPIPPVPPAPPGSQAGLKLTDCIPYNMEFEGRIWRAVEGLAYYGGTGPVGPGETVMIYLAVDGMPVPPPIIVVITDAQGQWTPG